MSANTSGAGASAPRLPAADSSPAGPPSRRRQPPRAAPHPARHLHHPVRRLDPRSAKSPRTRRRRPRPRGTRERPPTAADETGTGGGRAAPFDFLSGCRHATTVTVASGAGDRVPAGRSADPQRSGGRDDGSRPAPAPPRLRTCGCIRSRCAQSALHRPPAQPGSRRRGSWAVGEARRRPELQLE